MIPTTSLDTSRVLKESGFPQESFLLWGVWDSVGWIIETQEKWYRRIGPDNTDQRCISAPSTDELLAELPESIYIYKTNSKWHVDFCYEKQDICKEQGFVDESLPECLASMWLYLKQHNLLGEVRG